MRELKTRRLRLIPLSPAQLELLLSGRDKLDAALGFSSGGAELDEHMKQAVREMYRGCMANPDKVQWYTNWQIVLRTENRSIGSIGFLGQPVSGSVEIGYGIDADYRGSGYAGEALEMLVGWAFSQRDVYFAAAKTEKDNAPSQRVLEKRGFRIVGADGEEFLWEREKPASSWMSVYLCIGLSFGLLFGQMMGGLSLGMCIGMPIGLAVGLALDEQDKEKRKTLRAKQGRQAS